MRRFVPNVLFHSRCSARGPLGLRWSPTNTLPASAAALAASPTWWKVDTHEHSSISGDARADLGVISAEGASRQFKCRLFDRPRPCGKLLD